PGPFRAPSPEHRLSALVALGLSESEARLYLALVERPVATPTELATATGLPRQSIYVIAGSLQSRGLLREVPGKFKRFTAVAPDVAVDLLVSAREEALQALAETGRTVAESLLPSYHESRSRGAPAEAVEASSDAGSARRRATALLKGAKHRVVAALRDGPEARWFLDQTGPKPPEGFRLLLGPGASANLPVPEEYPARFLPVVPISFLVVDGLDAFLMLPAEAGLPGGTRFLHVRHPAFAAMLLRTFEAEWAVAHPRP
ncbi:MAG TPA: helix-turn-helix domain-containing protein, partial [Candidatus Thermoplasmatota archaeon]|nr:helix-turn-helix domain-containing protein [Candidatus Thermoplasmatota archaeon]